jgi:hypothetical protein
VLFEKQLAFVEQDGGVEGRLSILAVGRSATPASTAMGSSRVAAASSSTADRQRARKLGFSSKSAGG